MTKVFIIMLMLVVSSAMAGVIPTNRLIPWQDNVGIPGGIPFRTNIFCNVKVSIPGTNIVAYGDDVTDDSIAIQTALNLCPSNEVVYIPTGTYLYTNAPFVKSYTTVRGDGMGKTILDCHGSSVYGFSFASGSGPFGTNNVSITANASRGSTNITLSSLTVPYTSAHNIAPGYCLILANLNDTNFSVYPGDVGGGSNQVTGVSDESESPIGDPLFGGSTGWPGPRYAGQTVMVLSTNSSFQVTFTPPLYVDYTNPILSPIACAYKPFCLWAGVENLTVKANRTGMRGDYQMNACAFCWLYGVEGNRTDEDQVDAGYDFDCQIDSCYFHDAFVFTSGTDNELLLEFKSSGCLIQNNVLWRLHSGIMLESGASGNVIAYNYWAGGMDSFTTNFAISGFIYHVTHPMFNLWEGNVGSKFNADSVHGSSSDTVLFRNWFWDGEWCNPPLSNGTPANLSFTWEAWQYNEACWISALSPVYSVVGNVLGTDWGRLTNGYWSTIAPKPFQFNGSPFGAPQPIGIAIGYFGDDTGTNVYDTNHVFSTAIITGNYDPYDRTNQWDMNGIQTLPNSYYLTNTPSWWTNYGNASPWPPIGPDVAGLTNTIPAQLMFNEILNGVVTNLVLIINPTNASVTLAQNVNYNLQWQTNGVTDIAPQNGNNTLTVFGINIIGVDSASTLVNGAYNRNQAATIVGSTNVYGVAKYNGLTLTSNIVPLSQTNAVIPPAGMVYYPGFYAPMFFSSFYYIGTNATGLFAAPGVNGSAAVPLDGSIESNFDYNMSFITTRSIPKTVIHLQQGVFLTDGDLKWNLRTGNTLDGKGTNLTVIQFYAHDITNGTIVNSRVIAVNGGMHGGISVSNLTVDCNYQFGVPNITLKGGTLLGSSNIWFNVAVKNPAGWNPSVEDFGLSIFADSIGAGEGNLMSGCSITNYTGTNQDISGFNFTGLQDSVMSNNVVWQQSTNRVYARNITGNNILVISNQSFNCTVVQYQDSTPGGTNIFIVGNYDTNFTQFFDVKSGLYSGLIMSNNVGYLSRGIPTDNGTLVLIGSSPGVYACAVTNFTFIFNNFNSSSQVTNGVFDVHNSANINVFTNVLYAAVPATLETNFPGCVNIVLTGNTNQVGATPWPP